MKKGLAICIWSDAYDLTANHNFFSLGKVGIGTTNLISCADCNDYNLFVTKGIRTEKIKVDIAAINGWADFVFDSNYKIMSLSTLRDYILKNKHLPEIQTESEVKVTGLDIAESQKKLLQKVEELTLYILELNSENEKLKAQVSEILNASNH